MTLEKSSSDCCACELSDPWIAWVTHTVYRARSPYLGNTVFGLSNSAEFTSVSPSRKRKQELNEWLRASSYVSLIYFHFITRAWCFSRYMDRLKQLQSLYALLASEVSEKNVRSEEINECMSERCTVKAKRKLSLLFKKK